MKKFFKYGNKGFTLIELLVVIAILGTLAAVVVLNVTKYMGSGKTEANATDKANVQTALAALLYDNKGAAITAGTITAGDSNSVIKAYILGTTKCTYAYDSSGSITSQTCP